MMRFDDKSSPIIGQKCGRFKENGQLSYTTQESIHSCFIRLTYLMPAPLLSFISEVRPYILDYEMKRFFATEG